MANNHSADRELETLLRGVRAQGFLVGIDELAPALRANLVELKQGRDIGLRDPDGGGAVAPGLCPAHGQWECLFVLIQVRERECDALHHHLEPNRQHHGYPVCRHEFR